MNLNKKNLSEDKDLLYLKDNNISNLYLNDEIYLKDLIDEFRNIYINEDRIMF